tara:strand:- start:307 stop:1140 length:834 start_codon:yes stop_codon:yes gene_type:complete
MRNKHNKKRNTAFLYEILVRETTRAVINKDAVRKKKTTDIIREHFKKGTCLYDELQLYKSLMETTDLNEKISEKLLSEVKVSREKIVNKKLFNEQTKLISNINSNLGPEVYSNFIPNYKNIANVFQLFNPLPNVKDRVLLEQLILKALQSRTVKEEEKMDTIDNLVFKTFVGKFNEAYSGSLTDEQKNLVTNYVFSFSDNGIGLKVYLNEELGRLKKEITNALSLNEIKSDDDMMEKTKSVLEFLDSFAKKENISEQDIKKLLKVQMLAEEVLKDGN